MPISQTAGLRASADHQQAQHHHHRTGLKHPSRRGGVDDPPGDETAEQAARDAIVSSNPNSSTVTPIRSRI